MAPPCSTQATAGRGRAGSPPPRALRLPSSPTRRGYDALAVSKRLRLALVAIGLAVAVYGVASLTGGWLGAPPWWRQEVRSPSTWQRQHPEWLGEGREWIGVSVTATGLALTLAASSLWTRRRVLGVLGLTLAIYALASLTGGWLWEPPWWRTHTAPPEVVDMRARFSDWLTRLNASTPGKSLVAPKEYESLEAEAGRVRDKFPAVFRAEGPEYLRSGREWVSAGVVAGALALAVFAAWPRRSRPPADTAD